MQSERNHCWRADPVIAWTSSPLEDYTWPPHLPSLQPLSIHHYMIPVSPLQLTLPYPANVIPIPQCLPPASPIRSNIRNMQPPPATPATSCNPRYNLTTLHPSPHPNFFLLDSRCICSSSNPQPCIIAWVGGTLSPDKNMTHTPHVLGGHVRMRVHTLCALCRTTFGVCGVVWLGLDWCAGKCRRGGG